MSTSFRQISYPPLPPIIKEVVFEAGTIQKRVRELARAIAGDYQGRDLLIVGILKGAFMFTSDLVRELELPHCSDFIRLSRYGREREGSEVELVNDLEEDIAGRDVLLVEDIVDTGLTLNHLISVLEKRRPASLAVCSLLERPDLRLVDIPIRWVGFEVEKEFLIGYGLDYRDYYRDLPFIATMNLDAREARRLSFG